MSIDHLIVLIFVLEDVTFGDRNRTKICPLIGLINSFVTLVLLLFAVLVW